MRVAPISEWCQRIERQNLSLADIENSVDIYISICSGVRCVKVMCFISTAIPLIFRKIPIHAIILLIFSIGCSDEPIKNEAVEELLQFKVAFVVGFDQ